MSSKMVNFSSSCRTCMRDDSPLIDLYQTVMIGEKSLQLVELLLQCTTLTVSKEDGLPQSICNECANFLETLLAFRINAANSEMEFLKLLKNAIKHEPPELDVKEENSAEEDQDFTDSYDTVDFGIDILKSEIENKCEMDKYKCEKCNITFASEKSLLKHLEYHDKPVFRCHECDKSYHSRSTLNRHVAKTHGDTDKSLIDRAVESTKFVKTEQRREDEVFHCTLCEAIFSKLRSLAMHMKKHKSKAKTNSYICDSCGKKFTKKSLLKRHVLIHNNSKKYKCTICPKQYSRYDQYKHHIYTHGEKKPYECEHCKKGFSQLCSLKDHVRIHTGETPYLCSECGKGFANGSNLRQHMMRHTGLKPFSCNLCPKTFCTKGQMTSHMSTHSGEHPYRCEECGATFTKPNSLKKHALIHLGVRPFGCDTCNMRFTCKDHLKRHQRIHTGEKPYQCNYCDRAFTQSNDLVKHTRGHIGQNIYQCTICSTRFRLLSELKQHYPIHFGKDKTVMDLNPNNQTISNETLKETEPKNIDFNKDLSLFKLTAPQIDKNLPVPTKPMQYDKKFTGLNLKSGMPNLMAVPDVKHLENRITITINGCDKDGVVGDITINIAEEDS